MVMKWVVRRLTLSVLVGIRNAACDKRSCDGEESTRRSEAWRKLRESLHRELHHFLHCGKRSAFLVREEVGHR